MSVDRTVNVTVAELLLPAPSTAVAVRVLVPTVNDVAGPSATFGQLVLATPLGSVAVHVIDTVWWSSYVVHLAKTIVGPALSTGNAAARRS